MLSAWLTPVFWTSIWKLWPAPPAVTVAESNVLVTTRVTSSTMATVSVAWSAASSSDDASAALPTVGSASVVVSTL